MTDMNDEFYYEKLCLFIKDTLKFPSSHYSTSFLKRRISCRQRAIDANTFYDYYSKIENDLTEQQKLLKELTIHVTHFFRDESMWNILKSEIIPLIVNQKKTENQKKIRVWSAGSSTGEEVISILISFLETLKEEFYDYDIKFLATDIDPKSIDFGKLGIYEKFQFKETPQDIIEKYFEVHDDKYKFKTEYLNKINFRIGDIISDEKPKNLDLIFCRNTVIYFSKEIKEKLYPQFYDCLNDGGFFIMGKTETLIGNARLQFKIFNTIEKVYRK